MRTLVEIHMFLRIFKWSSHKDFKLVQATRKEETGVPRAGRKTLSGGHGCKVCIECGKSYTPNKEKDGKVDALQS